jgi:hypothetical protein
MKVKVFADRSGKILATFRPTSGGKDAPSHVRIDVEGGHEHEIEVPDDLVVPESIHKLHSEYRVDSTGPAPKLIKPK